MKVKELFQMLGCFNPDLDVVIAIENLNYGTKINIEEVTIRDGRVDLITGVGYRGEMVDFGYNNSLIQETKKKQLEAAKKVRT